jgi:hypothetical protein
VRPLPSTLTAYRLGEWTLEERKRSDPDGTPANPTLAEVGCGLALGCGVWLVDGLLPPQERVAKAAARAKRRATRSGTANALIRIDSPPTLLV